MLQLSWKIFSQLTYRTPHQHKFNNLTLRFIGRSTMTVETRQFFLSKNCSAAEVAKTTIKNKRDNQSSLAQQLKMITGDFSITQKVFKGWRLLIDGTNAGY
jgi:hypothetical protein